MRRYIKLHTVILTNDKVAGLSSDAARWHYAKLLLHAKQTEPEGRWRSMSLLRSSVGEETFAYVPEFMATLGPDGEPEGLLVQTDEGELKIRQWWHWAGSDRKARQGDLADQAREKNREKWARNKRNQRAKAKGGHVHPMSTNVHPNRETESLSADSGHVRAERAPVPRPSSSMRMVRCGDCHTLKPANGFCTNPKCSPH